MFVRLFRFRSPRTAELTDGLLREQIEPSLLCQPGLRYMYAGRGSGPAGEERLLATVWEKPADRSDRLAELNRPFDFERAPDVHDLAVEALRLAAAIEPSDGEPPSILRVFRGRVRPGELDAYLAEVQSGTLADIARDYGPSALFLGTAPPESFVTVSVWSSWERIALATGGNIHQPIATRHEHRLIEGDATHLEIVPHTTAGQPASTPAG